MFLTIPPATFLVTVPRNLIRLRGLHQLSQSDLAVRAHVAPSTLNLMEQGFSKKPSYSTLYDLGEQLGHTRPDALTGQEHAFASNLELGACPKCGMVLAARGAFEHGTGDCILFGHQSGHTNAFLASLHGLTVFSIEVIIDQMYSVRRTQHSYA
jgi:DNA-binding XRE family transcriptional regulator